MRLLKILLVLSTIAFAVYSYIKVAIISKIDGRFKEVSIDRININITPTVNLYLKFIINNRSAFKFVIRKLKVTIYDNANKEFLAQSVVNEVVELNKGENEVAVKLENLSFSKNISNYISNKVDLFVVIEFKILGIKVLIKEIVNF